MTCLFEAEQIKPTLHKRGTSFCKRVALSIEPILKPDPSNRPRKKTPDRRTSFVKNCRRAGVGTHKNASSDDGRLSSFPLHFEVKYHA